MTNQVLDNSGEPRQSITKKWIKLNVLDANNKESGHILVRIADIVSVFRSNDDYEGCFSTLVLSNGQIVKVNAYDDLIWNYIFEGVDGNHVDYYEEI